jgi:hypothetical protein
VGGSHGRLPHIHKIASAAFIAQVKFITVNPISPEEPFVEILFRPV